MITDTRLDYNSKDIFATRAIFDELYPLLDEQTRRVYEAEIGLQGINLGVQFRGIRVDLDLRRQVIEELEAEAAAREKQIEEIAGIELNPRSPQQLKAYLYDFLGLRAQKNFKTGEITTDEEALTRISKRTVPVRDCDPIDGYIPDSKGRITIGVERKEFCTLAKEELEQYKVKDKTDRKDRSAQIATLVLESRDLLKQASSLADSLLEKGRMRTTLVVGGTESYRYSSHKTWNNKGHNQQNVDKRLRRCFVPDPGYLMIQQDQSSAESMTVAYCAGDEKYIAAHLAGSTHVVVARMLFPSHEWAGDATDKAYAKATMAPSGRMTLYDTAKRVQHGLNYLLTPHGLAHHASMTVKEAQEKYNLYFLGFPGIPKWHDKVIEELKTTGRVSCPGDFSRVFFGRKNDRGTHREAISFIPQAIIAWNNHICFKRFFLELDSEDFQVLGHIHDSVVSQVKIDLLDEYLPKMEKLSKITWPVNGRQMQIKWEVKTGYDWGSV